jgi:YVTN family beta-propeller protein
MMCKPFRVTVAVVALFLGAAQAHADLIVVENGANDILRISDTGFSKTLFSSANLVAPIGLGLDTGGNVYAVNLDSVSKYSPTGSPLGFFVPPGSGTLAGPIDIAFDSSNNGFVTNQNSGSSFISEYNSAGVYQGFFGTGTFNGQPTTNAPTGIGYNPTNNQLYVANSGNNSFTIYNASTLNVVSIVTPTGAGALDTPEQIAFDSQGNVYIASFGSATGVSKVQEYTAAGTFIRSFIPTGDPAAGAEGVAVDPNGNVFVSLFNRGTIEKFNSAGVNQGVIASGLNGVAFIQFQAVPEPGSLALAGFALIGAAGYHFNRRRRAA